MPRAYYCDPMAKGRITPIENQAMPETLPNLSKSPSTTLCLQKPVKLPTDILNERLPDKDYSCD